jgi:hypothetical protein
LGNHGLDADAGSLRSIDAIASSAVRFMALYGCPDVGNDIRRAASMSM